MKISIIGPATQIPPVGWGAVESLIWDYSVNLKKEGHDVDIINIANPKKSSALHIVKLFSLTS